MRYIHGHHRRGGKFPTGKVPHNFNGGFFLNKQMNRWIINCADGTKMLYSRAVMEAELGRELLPDEHVHHINNDSTDDRPENLQLISPEEHGRLHLTPERARSIRALANQ